MSVEGFVDPVVDGLLRGWAWEPADANRIVYVEVFDGYDFYIRTDASQFRSDLEAAGKRSGYCGFSVSIPASVVGETYVLVCDTGHRLNSTTFNRTASENGWLETRGGKFRSSVLLHRLTGILLGRTATPLERLTGARYTNDLHSLTCLVRTILQNTPSQTSTQFMEHLVEQVYVGVLGREPEERGFELYGNALRAGMSLADLIRELILTPEFTDKIVPFKDERDVSADTLLEFHNSVPMMKDMINTLLLKAIKVECDNQDININNDGEIDKKPRVSAELRALLKR